DYYCQVWGSSSERPLF
nr:immunoglobulin light chain junction region [Macaca mulatta]MOW57756.1 immunoglobulin light chain junction region [Macaca mulatta]MOW59851.1 immunoglobulin light chain junction region [Macaca mulatta]